MIKITCVVENSVKLGSPFWGEHGMSVLIENTQTQERTLFDTGQSGDVLLHNLQRLNVAPDSIQRVVLSHGHYDHAGGLYALLKARNTSNPLPIYGHPDIFSEHFSTHPNGHLKPVMMPKTQTELETLGAQWVLDAKPLAITAELFTTGEIPKLEPLENFGDERLVIQNPNNPDERLKDPIKDDMSLVIKTSKGLVVVLGCCHAGVINTLNQIEQVFPNQPILAMMGGTHLASASEARLQKTAERVAAIPQIGFSHCTGIPVMARFLAQMPQQAFVFQVGTELTFDL